jgi:hypothetical protein
MNGKFDGRMKSFWLVVNDERGMAHDPYLHESAEDAFREAQRLAETHQGRFYVFESKGFSRKVTVQTVRTDDYPF